MYKCQVTGRLSKEGEKLNKIVVATREVEYKHWDRDAEEEWFSHGTEIVREINASEEGVQVYNALSPEDRAVLVKSLG
jgi:hypothetical protein